MERGTLILLLVLAGCSPGGGGATAATHAPRAASHPGPGGGSNPLLGSWKLVEGNPNSCGAGVTYTADTEATTYPDPSQNESHKVSFNVSPGVVYVMGSGGAVQYDITGPKTMQWHGTSPCKYQRAG